MYLTNRLKTVKEKGSIVYFSFQLNNNENFTLGIDTKSPTGFYFSFTESVIRISDGNKILMKDLRELIGTLPDLDKDDYYYKVFEFYVSIFRKILEATNPIYLNMEEAIRIRIRNDLHMLMSKMKKNKKNAINLYYTNFSFIYPKK